MSYSDHYDWRGRLVEEPDTEWCRENGVESDPPTPAVRMASDDDCPELIRFRNEIWVFTAEGHWCRFSGATAALEAFVEAERRYAS